MKENKEKQTLGSAFKSRRKIVIDSFLLIGYIFFAFFSTSFHPNYEEDRVV